MKILAICLALLGVASAAQAQDVPDLRGTWVGKTKAAIFGSTEYLRDLAAGFYEQFLKRSADESGLNSYVQDLRAGVPPQVIIAVLLGSDEFFVKV